MAFLGGIFGRKRKPDHQEFAKLLPAFIRARTWAEAQHVVKQHPALLSDEAEALLDQRIAAAREQGKQDSARVLEERHTWLRHCRQASAEATPAESASAVGAQRAAVPVLPEFLHDLRQAQEAGQCYLRTGDHAALDEAAAAWERILKHVAFAATPERFQLAALNDSGGIFLHRYWARGRVDDLNQALACWQQAVQRTPPDSPDLPALLNNLGLGLRDRYARTGELADLAVCRREGFPPNTIGGKIAAI